AVGFGVGDIGLSSIPFIENSGSTSLVHDNARGARRSVLASTPSAPASRSELASKPVKFMVLAWDAPGESGVARRDELRAAHMEGISERFHDGSVIVGAGIYDDAGVVRGSVVILDCESRADVDSYLGTE